MSSGFAKVGDSVSSETKQAIGANDNRDTRTLLPYLRCLTCKQQMAIQTCGTDKEQRCHDFDNVEEIGESNLHTHVVCSCGERTFSGIVSFRTTRDTDAFNKKKKMTLEEKRAQFKR